jgi:ABC-type transport system substrate-binding protein
MINVAYSGVASPAVSIISVGCADYQPDMANLHDTYSTGYNMELAKKYAEESGLVGKTVRLVTNGTDVYATAAQIIEQALKEIGVNAEVQNYDQATVRNMIAGPDDWEVYVSWTSNPSEVGLDIIYSQISKFNRCHFDHDEALFNSFKERGEELLGTSDEAKYHDLFKSYLKDFEDQCFVFGIADTNWIMAANESLQGVKNFGHAYDYVADWYFVD